MEKGLGGIGYKETLVIVGKRIRKKLDIKDYGELNFYTQEWSQAMDGVKNKKIKILGIFQIEGGVLRGVNFQ